MAKFEEVRKEIANKKTDLEAAKNLAISEHAQSLQETGGLTAILEQLAELPEAAASPLILHFIRMEYSIMLYNVTDLGLNIIAIREQLIDIEETLEELKSRK